MLREVILEKPCNKIILRGESLIEVIDKKWAITVVDFEDNRGDIEFFYIKLCKKENYCPNCGVKMEADTHEID